jgi:hypothetical protein
MTKESVGSCALVFCKNQKIKGVSEEEIHSVIKQEASYHGITMVRYIKGILADRIKNAKNTTNTDDVKSISILPTGTEGERKD